MHSPVAMLHTFRWDDVRIFLALARSRSLVFAARELGVDRATVSRRIAALERSLRSRLFLRTRDGFRLSPAAEALLGPASEMSAAAHRLGDAPAMLHGSVAGQVRVATTESFAARLVASGLLELTRLHPMLELELLGGNRPVDLTRAEADLALRLSPPSQQSLTSRVLARLPVALFAAPSYLERRGLPRSAADFDGHDVLIASGELAALPESRWLAGRRGARVAFRSSSLGALVEAARAGFGIAAITTAWGESEPGLQRVLDLRQIAPRPVWLLATPTTLERPAVRVVADRLADLLKVLGRQ